MRLRSFSSLLVTSSCAALTLLLVPTLVRAHGGGISTLDFASRTPTDSSGCADCHGAGASPPSAVLKGPTSVAAGSLSTFTLDMTAAGGRTYGSLNVSSYSTTAANVGTLSVATGGNSASTKLISGYQSRAEITHTGAKSVSSGHVLWDFKWTAPSTCGASTTLYAWALNSNGSKTSGDAMVRATLAVSVACTGSPNGSACTSGTQCTSGNCIDGYCCNSNCGNGSGSDCQACNVTGLRGTCSAAPSTTVCRASAGACDFVESCTGSSTSCPADGFASSATQCRAGSCSGTTATLSANCSGSSASCPAAQTLSCSAGTCSAGVCSGSSPLGNGAACGSDTQCTSGHCIDGYCCNSSCGSGVSTDCQACNVPGLLGSCSPAPSTTVCRPAAGPCDATESCTGSSTSCPKNRYASNATVCLAGSCVSGITTLSATCPGNSAACPAAVTQTCAPYACAGAACATTCTTTSECTTNAVCTNQACVASFANGKACSADSACQSGFCTDGVCCDMACDGQCQACDLSGHVGQCSPVTGAPRGARPACTNNDSACAGKCDGSRVIGCTYPASTVPCRGASCTGTVATLAGTCDGSGSCAPQQTQDCAPYACSGATCDGNCTKDTDCATGSICRADVCTAKLTLGEGCVSADQCTSGLCVDGVCCSSACSGQCEACDVVGQLGACVPVSGAPHSSHAPCGGTGNCEGSCDGTNASACAYPDTTTLCSAQAGAAGSVGTLGGAGLSAPGAGFGSAGAAGESDYWTSSPTKTSSCSCYLPKGKSAGASLWVWIGALVTMVLQRRRKRSR